MKIKNSYANNSLLDFMILKNDIFLLKLNKNDRILLIKNEMFIMNFCLKNYLENKRIFYSVFFKNVWSY